MNLYKKFDFQKSMSGVTMNAGDGALRRIPGKKSASNNFFRQDLQEALN